MAGCADALDAAASKLSGELSVPLSKKPAEVLSAAAIKDIKVSSPMRKCGRPKGNTDSEWASQEEDVCHRTLPFQVTSHP